ncbi:hypothetical protein MA9V1_066 [Chryseobacterium phage MA9V-1]|nr:hypothetical protein MA9V1_066 [Chryseobacterium phage MA9V-1]
MEAQYSKPKLYTCLALVMLGIALSSVSCTRTYTDNVTCNVYKIEEVCTNGYYVDEPAYMPVAQPDGSIQFMYYVNHVYKCCATKTDTILIGNQKDLK